MYHTKVVDYMAETKLADSATLVSKGMPTALITEMNKASSNIESLADKAASKTDPELNPQKRDRGTYCVWAHPKDTNQTKLSLGPTKCALPAKVAKSLPINIEHPTDTRKLGQCCTSTEPDNENSFRRHYKLHPSDDQGTQPRWDLLRVLETHRRMDLYGLLRSPQRLS